MTTCCGGRLAHGVAGLTKAALGLDAATPHAVAARTRECFGDEGRTRACPRLAWGGVCTACGCLAAAKVRVASEACPAGRWAAETAGGVERAAAGSRGEGVERRAGRGPVGPPAW